MDLKTFALLLGLLHAGGTFAGTFAGALLCLPAQVLSCPAADYWGKLTMLAAILGVPAGAVIALLTILTAPGREGPRTGARLGGDVARSALIGLGFALGCRFLS